MKKFFHILYQPYKWLVFFPLFVVSTCFLVLIGIIVLVFFDDYMANRTTGVWWARVIGFITPMKVEVYGRDHIKKHQSYIIVSNHQSMYDVVVLYGWLGIDLKWVIKKELRAVPIIGFAAEKGGNIFIDRSDPKAAYESLRQAKNRIMNRSSLIILPEGTRSRSGGVGEFKKGAFRLAQELQLPILPVTVMNTGNILPPKTLRLFPGKAIMKIHAPIDVASFDGASSDILAAKVRDIIRSGLEYN